MRNNLFNKKFKFFADITEGIKTGSVHKIKKIIFYNVDNFEKK
ncbi:hypothetical protein HMPREF3180_01471 [Leptotrichia wadei]|uniref:Uncharacterized protein n=1 Tax=Leptotrichia wadei TaxID=157687 RepID=A0A134A9H8_9FUSO|nr:hypothetical protein HMPREF3180_01471 [Leptotrichia wadei]